MKKKSTPKKKTKKAHELPARLANELAIQPMQDKEVCGRCYHAVNPGDLIACMGAIKKYYDITKRRMIVYQSTNTLAAYYANAVHPTVNERGENVCTNMQMLKMLKPLIECQEYIKSFENYEGQPFELDFNVIRGKTFVNMPQGALQNWIPFAFPDLAFDLSKQWITLPGECPEHIKKQVSGKIILNFTERYRNQVIDYFFLQNYAPDLIFAGTEKEHYLFCNRWGLNIPRLEINDFLELAYAIREARFLLANQSMNVNIAIAMKTKYVLEVCSYAQNVIHCIGEDSYGFFHQVGCEYYFRTLYNKTINK